jgi:hypothetical protein
MDVRPHSRSMADMDVSERVASQEAQDRDLVTNKPVENKDRSLNIM